MNWIVIILIIAAAYFLLMRNTSGYAELVTSTQDAIKSIFDLPVSLECTAGPGQKAAYYSTERPGGICGDQEAVKSSMRDYSINEGIGGSLLEK